MAESVVRPFQGLGPIVRTGAAATGAEAAAAAATATTMQSGNAILLYHQVLENSANYLDRNHCTLVDPLKHATFTATVPRARILSEGACQD
eukprot:gene9756-8007_t